MARIDYRHACLAFMAVCVLLASRTLSGQAAPERSAGAKAKAASANLDAFDVESVRPTQSGGNVAIGFKVLPDGIEANLTVRLLVRDAYGGFTELPTEDSITGLPGWANTEYFTIRAKMNEAQMAEFTKLGKKDQEQQREAMLRTLLADQFKLKTHREPKQVSDYDLVVAKGGPKLKEGSGPKDKDGKSLGRNLIVPQPGGGFQLLGFTMEELASFLGLPVAGTNRIVRDKTGLEGTYDITLRFAAAQGQFDSDPEGLPSIFDAVQEQLGLKLQPSTGTIHVVAVDHVEKPSDN